MTDRKHFIKCRICGKEFDVRDLTQVCYHETLDENGRHEPIEVIDCERGIPLEEVENV